MRLLAIAIAIEVVLIIIVFLVFIVQFLVEQFAGMRHPPIATVTPEIQF
jgi:hypothetical protein